MEIRLPGPLGHVGVFQMGGVIRALPPDDTAFGGRGAGHVLNVSARWPVGSDPGPHRAFVRGLWEAVRPFATGGVYVNYVGEGEDRVLAAYGRYRYDRLAEIKTDYDPDNVFRFNQNIRPDGEG